MKKTVLFKLLLFVVCLLFVKSSPKVINNDVNSSEELKANQQSFFIQGNTQSPEKISSFACLENNFFPFQVENISPKSMIKGEAEVLGSGQDSLGHAPKVIWVSSFYILDFNAVKKRNLIF